MPRKVVLKDPAPVKFGKPAMKSLANFLMNREAKKALNRKVGRGMHDLVWVRPDGAISMVIDFGDLKVNRLIQYAVGHAKATLPKSAHAALLAPATTHLTLHYVIELEYPGGTITIDPMVEILP